MQCRLNNSTFLFTQHADFSDIPGLSLARRVEDVILSDI